MTEEEKNGVEKNGDAAANSEMAPQEDGTKVPLTDGGAEVKFTSSDPPNGDAKIDMGYTEPTFSGLTKEELMKYSDDPFWVRLRWVLFIVFWAGWVAMLVVAIVIIVHAPRCAPKESLEWQQKSAMVAYDVNNPVDVDNSGKADENDVVKMAEDLGMTSIYLEKLINPRNFAEINPDFNETEIELILDAIKVKGLNVITDFVPLVVPTDNNWYTNSNMSDFFKEEGPILDMKNQGLLVKIQEVLTESWLARGVKGFLMAEADTDELKNAEKVLNTALQGLGGAVVSGEVDVNSQLSSAFDAETYRIFLNDSTVNWSYFKFDPKVAEGTVSEDEVRLVTLSLFLVPGTPILHGVDKDYQENSKEIIAALSAIREKESVQVGEMTFVNRTDDVVAYARVMKGTPGYAVAVNLHAANNATIDFSKIDGVADKGEVTIMSTRNKTSIDSQDYGKYTLSEIFLEPHEGIVVQFVPKF